MRKHFLILMLLSLLPLAGWAAIDISGYRITVQTDNYVYTGEAVAIVPQVQNENLTTPVPLTYGSADPADDDYDLVFYKDGVKLDGAPSAVGSYVVKAEGKGDYSGETSTGAGFIIRKAELTIEIGTLGNATANPVVPPTFKKNYKAADPEMPAIGTWVFKVEGTAIQNADGQAMLTVTTPSYEYTGEDANAVGYNITFKGFDLKANLKDNYDYTVVARTMIIDPIAITVGQNATVAVTPAAVPAHEYDGTAYKPTFTLKYAYGEGENDVYTLNSNNASDYVLKYYPYANNALGAAVTDPINAGTYHAYVTAGTSGNFTAANAPGVKVGEFAITKKALTIAVNPKTKDYDGEAFDEDDAEFTISGLASTDEGMIEGLAAEVHDNGVLSVNAGSWTMDVVSNEATIGTGENAPLLSLNYNVTPLSSTWKINQIALTVKAADETAVLGADVPESEVVVTGAINDTEKTIIKEAYEITPKDGLNTNAFGVTEDAYVISLIPAANYEDYEEGVSESYNNAQAVLGNYVALVAEETLLNGSLTVTGGNFIVMPVISNKIPYGTTPVPEVLAYTTGDNPTQLVENTDYEKVGNAYGFKVKLATDADEAANWKSIDQFTFAVNTTYNIKVDAATVKGKGNYVKAANAQEDNFTCASATFTIKPKKVYYEISDVTLHKGDTEANLNEGTAKATATLKTGAGFEDNTLVGEETLEITFKFADGVAGLVIDPQTHKISIEEGFQDDNDAITAEAGGEFAGNYEVDFTEGDLTIAASTLLLDDTDPQLLQKIKEAAATGENYDVTFASRTLKKEVWNVLVLPFATSAKEISEKFGYAVINVLDESKNDNDVHMKLHMGDIKANQPFLVKNYEEVNLGGNPTANPAIAPITINGQAIEATTGANAIAIDENGQSFVADLNGNKFIGVYKTADVWGPQYQYVTAKGILKDAKNFTETKPCTIKPLRAYFETKTANARIFVEELDGTVTAISSISADGIAVPAEGWYTVNGIKLESAPTQKGVYIRNGKKMVIK